MWLYEKKLQYPVKVSTCNPMLAKFLIEQYGGADGELAAALRYLNQRYSIPDRVIGLLTDIGTEEFAHLEMIATMIYKLTIFNMRYYTIYFSFLIFIPQKEHKKNYLQKEGKLIASFIKFLKSNSPFFLTVPNPSI